MPADNQRTHLRRRFRSARRNLNNRQAIERALNQHVLNFLSDIPSHNVVAAYVAMPEEVQLDRVYAQRSGQVWALPVVDEARSGSMSFLAWHADDALQVGNFGIQTPSPDAALVSPDTIALFLMPLVAFDDQGVRLGMGGGYYDRFLAQLRVDVPRVGIGFDCQRSSTALPEEPWDVHLTAAITESGVVEFRPQNSN